MQPAVAMQQQVHQHVAAAGAGAGLDLGMDGVGALCSGDTASFETCAVACFWPTLRSLIISKRENFPRPRYEYSTRRMRADGPWRGYRMMDSTRMYRVHLVDDTPPPSFLRFLRVLFHSCTSTSTSREWRMLARLYILVDGRGGCVCI